MICWHHASAENAGSGNLIPGNLLVSESFHKASDAVTGLGWRLVLGELRAEVLTGSLPLAADVAARAARRWRDGAGGTARPAASVPGAEGHLRLDVRADRVILALQTAAVRAQTTAGLQKWVFDSSAGEWKLAYTLQAGLNLGRPYTVPGYPTGINAATNLPWSPATDGLRNITGRVNPNGTVTIWAISSTVSGGGDQGADPNKLVEITDPLSATSPAAGESFRTIRTAGFGEVLRGVSFTPRS